MVCPSLGASVIPFSAKNSMKPRVSKNLKTKKERALLTTPTSLYDVSLAEPSLVSGVSVHSNKQR